MYNGCFQTKGKASACDSFYFLACSYRYQPRFISAFPADLCRAHWDWQSLLGQDNSTRLLILQAVAGGITLHCTQQSSWAMCPDPQKAPSSPYVLHNRGINYTGAKDFVFGANPELTELRLVCSALTKNLPGTREFILRISQQSFLCTGADWREEQTTRDLQPPLSISCHTLPQHRDHLCLSQELVAELQTVCLTFSMMLLTWSGNRSAHFLIYFFLNWESFFLVKLSFSNLTFCWTFYYNCKMGITLALENIEYNIPKF